MAGTSLGDASGGTADDLRQAGREAGAGDFRGEIANSVEGEATRRGIGEQWVRGVRTSAREG